MRVPIEAVELMGSTLVAKRRDLNAPAVKGLFCPNCGIRIMHRLAGRDTVNIKSGTLEDTSWMVPVGHVWTRSAQAWFVPSPGALVYEGQPANFNALVAAWAAATQGL